MSRLSALPAVSRPTSVLRALIVGVAAALTATACTTDNLTAPRAASSLPSDPAPTVLMPCGMVSRLPKPDLIATIVSAAPSTKPSGIPGTRLVTVWGSVKNVGGTCATTFRVGGTQWKGEETVLALLTLTETPRIDAKGYTKTVLQAGEEIAFTGTILIQAPNPGEWAAVRLHADACDFVDDEFLPITCRVAESNETNNASPWVIVPWP
jgi:hypothetical protein